MVWNPKLALGVAVVLWAPCLLKKWSFYIIGKQTSGFLCSQLYIQTHLCMQCKEILFWNTQQHQERALLLTLTDVKTYCFFLDFVTQSQEACNISEQRTILQTFKSSIVPQYAERILKNCKRQ